LSNMYTLATTGRDSTGNKVGGGNAKTRAQIINNAAQLMFGFDITTPCEDISEDSAGNITIVPKSGALNADCLDYLWMNANSDRDRGDEEASRKSSIKNTYVTIGTRFSGLRSTEGDVDKREKYPFQTCQRSGSMAPISPNGVANVAAMNAANARGSIEAVQTFYDGIHKRANLTGGVLANTDTHTNAVQQCYGLVKAANEGPVTNCSGTQSAAVVPTVAPASSDLLTEPMTFNGWRKPKMAGKELHLLSPSAGGVSAFLTKKLPATDFSTSFTARFANNVGDGMTFCIQNQSPNALGYGGGGLGFQGINPGVAIRLDSYTGPNSGSLSVGYLPTGAAMSQRGSGYDNQAESGDITNSLGLKMHGDWLLNVEIKYSNNTLSFVISNATNTALKYSRSIPNVDMSRLLGGNNAWFGFTAGTGAYSSNIYISNWKLTNNMIVAASPVPQQYSYTPSPAAARTVRRL
jgi:hypothetical protein